jgi:hypothetical protein
MVRSIVALDAKFDKFNIPNEGRDDEEDSSKKEE